MQFKKDEEELEKAVEDNGESETTTSKDKDT